MTLQNNDFFHLWSAHVASREGNGNPLQCSCLENPRDGGAWWAAVYGVAQSRTRLKRLSSSSMWHPLIELSHLSNLLQMLNDNRMVDAEFFGASCVVVRGSALMILSNGWQLYSSPSRLSFPLQNFLTHHCTVCSLAVPGPNVLLMLWVVSAALQLILNLNKKSMWICVLSNINSTV